MKLPTVKLPNGLPGALLGTLVRAGCVLCVSALSLHVCAAAEVPQAITAEPVATPLHVGAMTVLSFQDATDAIPNDGKVFGADVGAEAVSRLLAEAGQSVASIPLSINALLVRDGRRVMLFDTGLGYAAHGHLVDRMARSGISPASVTDVFLTHSHGDHAGGLLDAQGALVFPEAVVHVSAPEWRFMTASGKEDAKLTAMLKGRVKLFEPGTLVVPRVRSIALPGHTPGHVGYRIGLGARTILDVGDLVHSSVVSLARPDWNLGFDADQALGAKVRRDTLTQLAKTDERVFAPHFPYPGIGRVKAVGDHFVWQPEAFR